MERFTRLFESLLVFVYHCFDRIVIHGYLSGLSRPEQVVHFVRRVVGIAVVSKEVLGQRTDDYRNWVEAYARNHKIPMEWAEKGLRKEDHVLPALRRMEKRGAYGVGSSAFWRCYSTAATPLWAGPPSRFTRPSSPHSSFPPKPTA